MLQVKTFDISNDEGMNVLLKDYRLAPGATIIVSDGKVCVPYEDGEPITASQRRAFYQEEINKKILQRDVFNHMLSVNRRELSAILATIAKLTAQEVTPATKDAYDNNKQIREKLKVLENKRGQFEQIIDQSESEIARINADIEIYNEEIAAI